MACTPQGNATGGIQRFGRSLGSVALALTLLGALSGCSTASGAGGDGQGAAANSADKVGAICTPGTSQEGCYNQVPMVCVADVASGSGKWAMKGTPCASGETCVQVADAANKKTAICKAAAASLDAGSGDSGGGAKDASATADGSTNTADATAGADATTGNTDSSAVTCGDGVCGKGETNQTCPKDCPLNVILCGNGKCDAGETATSCPADCNTVSGPTCGDGNCDAGESLKSCPADCGSGTCGNGTCDPGETPVNCGADCGGGASCGDGTCDPGETAGTCPSDCGGGGGANCGNMLCDAGETVNTCPFDCDPTDQCIFKACPSQSAACFGDQACGTLLGCLQACAAGNQTCQQKCATAAGQAAVMEYNALGKCVQASGCTSGGGGGGSHICDANCGNKAPSGCYCDNQCAKFGDCCTAAGTAPNPNTPNKACTGSTCADCNGSGGPTTVCGNGTCEAGETTANCPKDCPATTPVCGNGTCDAGETPASCAADCATGATCTTYADVKPIFAANCTGGGCHSTSEFATSCFANYTGVAQRVASGNMPKGKKLSAADKAKIAAWAAAGGACTAADCP